ncbi:unnamed protein product [Urochloa humidicola]
MGSGSLAAISVFESKYKEGLTAGALISKQTEEKNSAIQQNHRLAHELEEPRDENFHCKYTNNLSIRCL